MPSISIRLPVGANPAQGSEPSIVPVIRQTCAARGPASAIMEGSGSVNERSGNIDHVPIRYSRTAARPRSGPGSAGSSQRTSSVQSSTKASTSCSFQPASQRDAKAPTNSASTTSGATVSAIASTLVRCSERGQAPLRARGVEELSVEPKGDMVRQIGPPELGELRCIEHEQERVTTRRVQDDAQDHALVLGGFARSAHEDGLPRVAAVLEPGPDRARLEVELEQLVDEVVGWVRPRSGGVHEAIAERVAPEVDAREVGPFPGQHLVARLRTVAGEVVAADFAQFDLRRRVAQPIEIEVSNDPGIRVERQVDRQLLGALERVDVVKAEERLGLMDARDAAVAAIDHEEPSRPVRLPLEVLDEGPAAEPELDRLEDQWILDEHDEAGRQGKAVDVGRLLRRDRRDQLGTPCPARDAEDLVGAPYRAGDVADPLARVGVVVRVGGLRDAEGPALVPKPAHGRELVRPDLLHLGRLG